MNDDWVRMLANELSAEESSALLTATLDELNEVLEHTPAVRDTTIRILEARLAAPLTENSWNSLIESLGAFLGRSSAYLLSWISYGDWKERMDQVSAHASPEAVRFLGELLGIFGYD